MHVPEPRCSDLRTGAVSTEPAIRSRVGRALLEVAEEGDGVPFEVCPVTIGTRFVVESNPEKRLVSDVRTDAPFEDVLRVPDRRPITLDARPAFVPVGVVGVEVVFLDDRFADTFSIDRAAMVPPCGCSELPLPVP
ncbi:hypothetical protein ACFQH2_15110 [Natronoarchaeum sp. GCM10025703]|uniref:hypothetical protein n=1 Tax=Natronoarchaeum sp. GCM10025703 TaxID=3252685 RepID=UPI00360C8DE7